MTGAIQNPVCFLSRHWQNSVAGAVNLVQKTDLSFAVTQRADPFAALQHLRLLQQLLLAGYTSLEAVAFAKLHYTRSKVLCEHAPNYTGFWHTDD